jgi:hypothetical protein
LVQGIRNDIKLTLTGLFHLIFARKGFKLQKTLTMFFLSYNWKGAGIRNLEISLIRQNMFLFNKLFTLVPLTGLRLLSTSVPVLSLRTELLKPHFEEPNTDLLQFVDSSDLSKSRESWWLATIGSVLNPNFWEEFKAWQAKLDPGRLYAVLIQPTFLDGQKKTGLPSVKLTKDWPLDELIRVYDLRIAKMQEEYNAQFLGFTDILFKDLGVYEPPIPAGVAPRVLPTPDPSTQGETESPPIGATAPSTLTYASFARPVSVRGTGGMDPVAQQIVAGLAPKLDEIKSSISKISPVRGYERLAETFASIVERAVAPVANAQPSQPLPALVAPDPRVDSLVNSVTALEARIQSTPFEPSEDKFMKY